MTRIQAVWVASMVVGGLIFGSMAVRQPFGKGLLEHPIVIYFALAALGLLVLRFTLSRPVPEVIPDRALFIGGVAGLGAFLVANFVVARFF